MCFILTVSGFNVAADPKRVPFSICVVAISSLTCHSERSGFLWLERHRSLLVLRRQLRVSAQLPDGAASLGYISDFVSPDIASE